MKSSSARVEVLQLELDASGDLGQSAVERIELARLADLLVRGIPLALRVVEAAEDLVGAVVVRRLQLGDLEQLDGLRGLVLGHVVLRQADVLRGVDLVARALARRLPAAPSRYRDASACALRSRARARLMRSGDGARLELLRHLVQMDGLVVHPLIGVAPRQRDEIVGIDGNARLPRRRCGSACVLEMRPGCSAMGERILWPNANVEGRAASARLHSSAFALPHAFQPALPGYDFSFPRDHGTHDEYKTEWWYYTGHLETDAGKRYGFELTFFRVGVVPPGSRSEDALGSAQSLARALRDHRRRRERLPLLREAQSLLAVHRRRGGGNARRLQRRLARDDAAPTAPGASSAYGGKDAIDLVLTSRKAPAIHGENGISVKAEGPGYASHYYSMTRLEVRGRVNGANCHGAAWMDHEFGSSALRESQQGWDWFSVQLDNDAELMLYQIRRKDGTPDATSSGSLISSEGNVIHLRRDQMPITPLGAGIRRNPARRTRWAGASPSRRSASR